MMSAADWATQGCRLRDDGAAVVFGSLNDTTLDGPLQLQGIHTPLILIVLQAHLRNLIAHARLFEVLQGPK